MAALTPIATLALAGADLLQRVATMQAGARQARLARAAQEAATRSRLDQLRADRDAAERERRERLRQTLAAARARLGGAGIASDGGSGAALLRGLAAESEAEGQEDSARRRRRIDDLLRNAAYGREIDLLERSQAQARQRLGLLRGALRFGRGI